MSMYNMIFGYNPAAEFLLTLIDMREEKIPRFRDCYMSVDGDIVIMTRTGGGNRGEYEQENQKLRENKYFKFDQDMRTDNTYALFHYTVPEMNPDHLKIFQELATMDPDKRWEELFEAMKTDGGKAMFRKHE